MYFVDRESKPIPKFSFQQEDDLFYSIDQCENLFFKLEWPREGGSYLRFCDTKRAGLLNVFCDYKEKREGANDNSLPPNSIIFHVDWIVEWPNSYNHIRKKLDITKSLIVEIFAFRELRDNFIFSGEQYISKLILSVNFIEQ